MCTLLADHIGTDKESVHSWFKKAHAIKTTVDMTPKEFVVYTESCRDVMWAAFGIIIDDPSDDLHRKT